MFTTDIYYQWAIQWKLLPIHTTKSVDILGLHAGGALWRDDEGPAGEGGGGGLHAEAQVQPRLVLHRNP